MAKKTYNYNWNLKDAVFTKEDMLDFIRWYDEKKEDDCHNTFGEEFEEFMDGRKSFPLDEPVKPACGYCRDCKFEDKSICNNPTNRQMLVLEDDERFYIYPKFSCNKFESKSV